WSEVGDGWKHLHGSVSAGGVSFEWHDFKISTDFDWGKSFDPNSVEICLNLAGNGRVSFRNAEAVFAPLTAGFYRRGEQELEATRQTDEHHRFLTVEMSFDFLQRNLSQFVTSLHPLVQDVISKRPKESALSPVTRLTNRHQQLLASLRQAPMLAL